MDQSQLIKDYNDKYREKFNPALFERSDDDIINELKKIILSCQREKFYTIKVLSFRVVEDYKEINDILYRYEESQNKNKDNKKKKDNKYDFIDLKDSDIKLLLVKYFISIKDKQETITVIIAIPRIVDKYYFKLNGNVYSAMYQIVDASTYNNSTTSSKKHSITMKTAFMPIRIYRNSIPLRSTKKEAIKCTNYKANIFSKSVSAMRYIFAKFGFYGALKFMGMSGLIGVSNTDPDDDSLYTFLSKKNDGVFISTPKDLFANNMLQCVIYTILESISKDTTAESIFGDDYWISSLGSAFNINSSYEKGLSVLDSVEFIYDIGTKESIHLPEESKADIYCILRWLMGEFNELRIKDNLNISTKKIRCAEYIASLYAMKLSKSIYWISSQGNRADINYIKKAIMTGPMYLLGAITKCQLVNYRNMINDTDAITALKFTYKGIAGIGEKGGNSIPNIYRLVDISHLGRVDPDSSTATDPGITGTICPLTQLSGNMHFSDFTEPNTWESEFQKTVKSYKALIGLKEAVILKKHLLDIPIDKKEIEKLDESIGIAKKLISPIYRADDDKVISAIPLEEGGVIYYE